LDATVGSLLIAGLTFVVLGAIVLSPRPVALRSTYYLIPFSVVFLVVLLGPDLFQEGKGGPSAPIIALGLSVWLVFVLSWDYLLGDLHVVNADRYGLLDAVRGTLGSRKLAFTFDAGGEGVRRVARFGVPEVEGIVQVAYYRPLRLAVVRFHATGMRRFEGDVERAITTAIRDVPASDKTSFAALNMVVGAALLLLALGIYAA
jgi:hypothetical protein